MLIEERPVSHLERILHLKKAPNLRMLPAQELAVIADSTRERFFRKGSVMLREGEPIGSVYIVVDGTVHVRRRGRDLGHASQGAAVGGLGVVADDEDGVGAVAETDVLCLELESDAMLELLEDHFTILRLFLQQTCRSIVDIWSRAPIRMPRVQAGSGQVCALGDLDLVERVMFLRQGGPFARASINALAELCRGMVELEFAPDVTLWSAGERARNILLVVQGEIECTIPPADNVFRAVAGMPLGAAEAIAGVPRFYQAVTLERTTVLSGDVEGLLDVFEDNFDVAQGYLASVARWLLRLLELSADQGGPGLGGFYGCEALDAAG